MRVAHLVSATAISKAMVMGFADTEEEATACILDMAHRSALTSSLLGNRRYGVLFLRVDGGVVQNIHLDEESGGWCSECFGTEVTEFPDGSTVPCGMCQPS